VQRNDNQIDAHDSKKKIMGIHGVKDDAGIVFAPTLSRIRVLRSSFTSISFFRAVSSDSVFEPKWYNPFPQNDDKDCDAETVTDAGKRVIGQRGENEPRINSRIITEETQMPRV
jgi:hypothetical protein